MKSAARTTALVVMPLATAANMQANIIDATTVFPVDDEPYCYASTGPDGGFCGGGAAQLGAVNSIAGVKLYTTGPVLFSAPSGGSSTLSLSSSGSLIGSLLSSTVIPISYQFEIGSAGPAGSSVSSSMWGVLFSMEYGPHLDDVGMAILMGAGTGSFSGTTSITTTADVSEGTNLVLNADFFIMWTPINGGQLSINVPQNSIDFNAATDAGGVPEPGSLSLLASGLALLGWKIARRRRAHGE